MESSTDNAPRLADATKQLAQQALVICENRIELFFVEVQEERDRILGVFWLGLGVAVFGFLAGVALSIAFAIACWQWSPVGALLILAALYSGVAGFLYFQLVRLRDHWESLPATFDQMRKDRECLDKLLK